jgi:hypothetical protein
MNVTVRDTREPVSVHPIVVMLVNGMRYSRPTRSHYP